MYINTQFYWDFVVSDENPPQHYTNFFLGKGKDNRIMLPHQLNPPPSPPPQWLSKTKYIFNFHFGNQYFGVHLESTSKNKKSKPNSNRGKARLFKMSQGGWEGSCKGSKGMQGGWPELKIETLVQSVTSIGGETRRTGPLAARLGWVLSSAPGYAPKAHLWIKTSLIAFNGPKCVWFLFQVPFQTWD